VIRVQSPGVNATLIFFALNCEMGVGARLIPHFRLRNQSAEIGSNLAGVKNDALD
jgi:hypothetical protein